jgi:hypothetical protein
MLAPQCLRAASSRYGFADPIALVIMRYPQRPAKTYFVATFAVSSPSRTRASVAMAFPSGSVARNDQTLWALAVSPAAWYARAALAW